LESEEGKGTTLCELKKITMKIIQAYKDANKEWEYFQEKSDPEESFSFGNRYLLEKPEIIKDLRKEFYEDIVFDLLREK
jgi:hypothetical protein